jgi:hypothetical protein
MLHRAYEEAGDAGLRAGMRDLAEVIGVEEARVEENYLGLWEELKENAGRKRGREEERVTRKAGGLQVMLDLGDIIAREVEAKIQLFNLKRTCTEPLSCTPTAATTVISAETTLKSTTETVTKATGVRIPKPPKPTEPPVRVPPATPVCASEPLIVDTPSPIAEPPAPLPIAPIKTPPVQITTAVAPQVIDVEIPSPQPLKQVLIPTPSGPPLSISYLNEVDQAVMPSNWTYISTNDLGQTSISDSKQSCKCGNLGTCKDPRLCPCAQFNLKSSSTMCFYSGPTKRLTGYSTSGIASSLFECSPECMCNKEKCVLSYATQGLEKKVSRNLVVSRSKAQEPVWTLQTLEAIGKDEFVLEITGEVIAEAEYVLRDDPTIASLAGGFYLDNRSYGNVGRFLGHSCASALAVVRLYAGLKDSKLTRLMLYSTRDLSAGQELTVNWEQLLTLKSRWKCECGAKGCKGYIGA